MDSTRSTVLVRLTTMVTGAVGAGFGRRDWLRDVGHFAWAPRMMASCRARDTVSVVARYSSEVR